MILARQLLEGVLDLGVARCFRHAQGLVRVLHASLSISVTNRRSPFAAGSNFSPSRMWGGRIADLSHSTGKMLAHPSNNLGGDHRTGSAGNFSACVEQDHGRDTANA